MGQENGFPCPAWPPITTALIDFPFHASQMLARRFIIIYKFDTNVPDGGVPVGPLEFEPVSVWVCYVKIETPVNERVAAAF